MAKSSIEWTGHTWNPIVGCSKISAGCAHCYAETMARRLKAMGRPEYQDTVNGDGKWTGRVTLVPERLDEPLKRKKPTVYFVNSMSDLFHEGISDDDFWSIMEVIRQCCLEERGHIFQVLTKRPKRMQELMQWWYTYCHEHHPWPNLWLGVSIENQEAAFDRVEWLVETPAAIRFLSCEPLLGPIDLEWGDFDLGSWIDHLHWVIAGGESGPNARPMHPDWVRSIRDQCLLAGVPFFFKQWGAFRPADFGWKLPEPKNEMVRVGKKAAGRLLDGREWSEMPEVI